MLLVVLKNLCIVGERTRDVRVGRGVAVGAKVGGNSSAITGYHAKRNAFDPDHHTHLAGHFILPAGCLARLAAVTRPRLTSPASTLSSQPAITLVLVGSISAARGA